MSQSIYFEDGVLLDQLLACVDLAYSRQLISVIGPNAEIVGKADVVQWYSASPSNRLFSLNSFFDEIYYRTRYQDVATSITDGVFPSGLIHYIVHGISEGRCPNSEIEQLMKVSGGSMPEVSAIESIPPSAKNSRSMVQFRLNFKKSNVIDFYNNIERFLAGGGVAFDFYNQIAHDFDFDYYESQCESGLDLEGAEWLHHYVKVGCKIGASPHRGFDEKFYLAFYSDVRRAVNSGDFQCGYHHYLIAGRAEGRLPTYDFSRALELKYPGLTKPDAINRVDELQSKLAFPCIRQGEIFRVNFVLPDLNPDIFFGGYETLINMIKYFVRENYAVRIIKTESDDSTLDYLKYHWERRGKFDGFQDIEILSRADVVPVSSNDRFIAYSVWDVLIARRFAECSDFSRVVALVQEYEPIFMENNSLHFLANSAYNYDVYPVYNSKFLKDFFEFEKLGPFSKETAIEGRDYAVFEHVITNMPIGDLGKHAERTLFFYARPEPHAGRNLFEIGILALRELLNRRPELRAWNFIGVGALSDNLSVSLGSGIEMPLRAKLPVDEYMDLMRKVDVCLSLMWAPHPSVVPFELLQTGSLVVTNAYFNRSKETLSKISGNLFPAECTLEGVVDALEQAIEALNNGVDRSQGVVRVGSETWSQTFSDVAEKLKLIGFL